MWKARVWNGYEMTRIPLLNANTGIPTLVLLGRHGDLKWRPCMDSSVAMATSNSEPLMLCNFLCRHGDRVATFLAQIARIPCFTYLWVFLHQILHLLRKCPWVLIKPETLDLTTLNTGKRPRIKHKETGMRAKIIPILVWSVRRPQHEVMKQEPKKA